MDLVVLGCKGKALRVIACRGRSHPGLFVSIVQVENRVHRPAILIRAGSLQVFHLQVELAIELAAQSRRQIARGQIHMSICRELP